MKSFFIKYWFLILVFFVALFLRLYKISDLPQGFDGDEAAFGYYAYSLLQEGTDEFGNRFPLYFPSIGDYKYPVYSYLSTIPVAVFGLSIFSTRFLSAFAGSVLVVAVYFLSFELLKSKQVAKLSSILLAISPYGIFFSRRAFESNVATCLVTLGILFFIFYGNSRKQKDIILSILFLALSVFTYSAARVFLILFLPFFMWYLYSIKIRKKVVFISIIFLITLSLISFIDPRSRVRANDVGFLNDQLPKKYLSDSIHEDGLFYEGKNIFLTRAFHNKITSSVVVVGKRYLEHFSPVYLFVESNPNMPKYSVPNMGLFYFIEFLTVIVGIYGLARLKLKGALLIGIWILFSVIPSSLSIESPNPVRGLLMLPPFAILSAVGSSTFIKHFKSGLSNKIHLIFGLILALHLFYFWHQYRIHDYYRMPWYSDEGTSEMASSVYRIKDNFDKVVMPDDPYIHFLFHAKTLPGEFVKNSEIEKEEFGKWERVSSFGNIIFKMPVNCPKIGRQNVLYVCRGGEIPQNSVLHKVVRYKDGVPAYLLLEFVPFSQRKTFDPPSQVNFMVETDLSFKEALLYEKDNRYW